jgi:(1->4)-alpha-D-glucan 1-alpha-D-glucosylmutase
VLRLTTPSVPDTYQGTEFWDFSLVDPDNRRAVDFTARRAGLADTSGWTDLLHHWRDGRLKQRVIRELLQLRARHPAVFARGSYRALAVETREGNRCDRLLAYQRELDGRAVIILVLRHAAGMLLDAASPRCDTGTTAVLLPQGARISGLAPGRYRNVLGGAVFDVAVETDARAWLAPLPVAVLEPIAS